MISLGRASFAERPSAPFAPHERDSLLGQGVSASPPRLGGGHFATRNRYHNASSLPTRHPLIQTEVLRAVSSQNGSLGEPGGYVRAHLPIAASDSPTFDSPISTWSLILSGSRTASPAVLLGAMIDRPPLCMDVPLLQPPPDRAPRLRAPSDERVAFRPPIPVAPALPASAAHYSRRHFRR